MDIVKRLREGRTVGTDLRWQVTDIHVEAAAEIEQLRALLVESYVENLYSAMAGISTKPEFTKDELMARIPEIAKSIVHEQKAEMK